MAKTEIKMKKVKPRVPSFMRAGKPKPDLPRISFNFETLPEGKNWKVGEEYEIKLVGKQVGMHSDEGAGSVELEIMSIGGVPHKNPNARVSRKKARKT